MPSWNGTCTYTGEYACGVCTFPLWNVVKISSFNYAHTNRMFSLVMFYLNLKLVMSEVLFGVSVNKQPLQASTQNKP